MTYYFKVAAVNEGGESPASEVVAALPSGGPKQVLIVNGFDRLDRTLDPKQPQYRKARRVDRVRPRQSNSRDYVVQVATAIEAAEPGTHVESTSNEAVINGASNLADYKTVLDPGQESTQTIRSTDGARKVEKFIAASGNLFVSGTEIGWDLDRREQRTIVLSEHAPRQFCHR